MSRLNPILEGFLKAIELLVSLDPEVYGIMLLSLRVSGTAVFLAAVLSIPLGALLGLRDFPGKGFVVNLVNTLMGLPPVVVGLVVYLILSSDGPLGPLDLLYTPTAMVLAQLLMCIPIIMGLTYAAVRSVDRAVIETAVSMGATGLQLTWTVLREAKVGLVTSVVTAFGAAISEVGAIMMVGGNIRYFTRALTTAIVLETRRGEFALAIALGIILLTLAFTVNLLLTRLQMGAERG